MVSLQSVILRNTEHGWPSHPLHQPPTTHQHDVHSKPLGINVQDSTARTWRKSIPVKKLKHIKLIMGGWVRNTRFARLDCRKWSEPTCTPAYIRCHISSAWQHNDKHTKTSLRTCHANARLAMVSCGGGGLSSFSALVPDLRRKWAGILQTGGLGCSWQRRNVRLSIQNIKVVDNGVPPCDLRVSTMVLVRLWVEGWQSLAGPIIKSNPACTYWMPRHSLPASSGRCLTGDGGQQWWRSYVLVWFDWAPDFRRKVSWFPAVRRPRLSTNELCPLFPSIKSSSRLRWRSSIPAVPVCRTPWTLSTVLLWVEGCLHQFSSSSVTIIQHVPIEHTTFKRKTDDWRSCRKTKSHKTRRSAEPPDSHISTTANAQKPHVHSLISGAMSALPDNQSPDPSHRRHFTWGTNRSLIWQRMRAVSTATFRKKWRWKAILRTVRERRKTVEEHQVSWIIFLVVRKKNYPRGFGSQYLVHKICSLEANGQLECLLTSRSSERGGRSPTNSMTNESEFLEI